MKRSDSITDLIGALVKAQAEMPNAFMDAEGMDGHRKYPYATLASVIEAIRPPFAANGLCFWQGVSMTAEKAVCVETTIAHVSGQLISEQLIRKPDRTDNVKGLGSEISYLKRYALMALAGCAAAEDDDEGEPRPAKGAPRRVAKDKAPPPPMPPQRPMVVAIEKWDGEKVKIDANAHPEQARDIIENDLKEAAKQGRDSLDDAMARHQATISLLAEGMAEELRTTAKELIGPLRRAAQEAVDAFQGEANPTPTVGKGAPEMPPMPDFLKRDRNGGAQA